MKTNRTARARFCTLALCVWVGDRAAALEVCIPSQQLQSPPGAQHLRVPILVSGSGVVDALGVDFVFSNAPGFSGWDRGNLVRSWGVFDVSYLAGNRLRFGGFQSGGTALTGADTLAVLKFDSATLNGACVSYRVENLLDDLVGAAPCEGTMQVSYVPVFGVGGIVGVYPPSASEACCFSTPDQTQLEVRGTLPASGTFDAAEFRIEVVPPAPAATFLWQPSAALLSSVGDPVDNTAAGSDSSGVIVRFECRSRSQGEILLGTVQVTGLHDAHRIDVTGHNRPGNSAIPCAQFSVCGDCAAPACMAGLASSGSQIVYQAYVNDCSPTYWWPHCVAIQPATWSQLKQLYR